MSLFIPQVLRERRRLTNKHDVRVIQAQSPPWPPILCAFERISPVDECLYSTDKPNDPDACRPTYLICVSKRMGYVNHTKIRLNAKRAYRRHQRIRRGAFKAQKALCADRFVAAARVVYIDRIALICLSAVRSRRIVFGLPRNKWGIPRCGRKVRTGSGDYAAKTSKQWLQFLQRSVVSQVRSGCCECCCCYLARTRDL